MQRVKGVLCFVGALFSLHGRLIIRASGGSGFLLEGAVFC